MEKKFISNFFTKPRYKSGKFVAGGFCLIVILITQFYWAFPEIGAQLHLSNFSLFYLNEFWRILTMNFIHADFSHLGSNLVMLFILSMMIYNYFGYYAFPLINLVGASLANMITISFYPQKVVLLGASTLIYHLWGFWFVIYLFGNRQYSFIMRLLRVLGVGFIILFPTTFDARTSYSAHFWGLIVGGVVGLGYFLYLKHFIYSFERYEVSYDDEDFELFAEAQQEESLNNRTLH